MKILDVKPIFIAKLNEDTAQILEAIPMSEIHDKKMMVKITKTNFIYYEKAVNIASTKEGAWEILKARISNLTRQIKELGAKNEL